jgi:hypothetical protein
LLQGYNIKKPFMHSHYFYTVQEKNCLKSHNQENLSSSIPPAIAVLSSIATKTFAPMLLVGVGARQP